MTLWYGFSSALLGGLLFFPMRKVILGMQAGRFRQREKREPSDDERQGLARRASLWAAVIAMTFAFFYNKFIMLKFF